MWVGIRVFIQCLAGPKSTQQNKWIHPVSNGGVFLWQAAGLASCSEPVLLKGRMPKTCRGMTMPVLAVVFRMRAIG